MTARQASAAIATTGAVGDGGSKEWLVLDTMDAMAGLERAFPHFHQTAIILARQDRHNHSETLKRRPWFPLKC